MNDQAVPITYEPWQMLEALEHNPDLRNAAIAYAAQLEVARHRGDLDWPEGHPNHPDYEEPEDGDPDS